MFYRHENSEQSFELIDTLWNVNVFTCVIFSYRYMELIDTLWNVNEEMQEIVRKSHEN